MIYGQSLPRALVLVLLAAACAPSRTNQAERERPVSTVDKAALSQMPLGHKVQRRVSDISVAVVDLNKREKLAMEARNAGGVSQKREALAALQTVGISPTGVDGLHDSPFPSMKTQVASVQVLLSVSEEFVDDRSFNDCSSEDPYVEAYRRGYEGHYAPRGRDYPSDVYSDEYSDEVPSSSYEERASATSAVSSAEADDKTTIAVAAAGPMPATVPALSSAPAPDAPKTSTPGQERPRVRIPIPISETAREHRLPLRGELSSLEYNPETDFVHERARRRESEYSDENLDYDSSAYYDDSESYSSGSDYNLY